MRPYRHLIPCLALSLLANASACADNPRSIILLIGDGFDDQHVTMGRNYLQGSGGMLGLDMLPMRGAVQVETVGEGSQPLYVADSANTATTLATGVVTQIGRIGTDAADFDAPTIAEAAIGAGLRAGLVSTASVTDATPAAFAAHVAHRSCENPESVLGSDYYGVINPGCPQDARDNEGPGSIAEQLASSGLTVILGGGATHFDQALRVGPAATVVEEAASAGFHVVRDRAELRAAPDRGRLLGLFAPKHLPVRWQGSDGRRAESAYEQAAKTPGAMQPMVQPEPMRCEPNPAFADTPSLAEMTEKALALLSADNERGFFLMVESASIDKQSHGRNPCGSIGEIEQLEEALAAALAFAETQGNTLIVVTADHAQAAQIIPEPSLYGEAPDASHSPGKIARIVTPEGSMMRINYATTTRSSETHTGANVPLFANAPGQTLLQPYMRQRDLHAAMMTYLGLTP
jgi:alkaline phosphatase